MSGCTGCANTPLKVRVKYHTECYGELTKIDQGDWIDLRAAETVELEFMEFKLVSLGIAVHIPKGYEMHIVPRSSTFKKFGVIQTNHMGIIDNSYCGDDDIIRFPALAMRKTTINEGDRICQFRLCKNQKPIEFETVSTLGNTNRGGFGSTGVQ